MMLRFGHVSRAGNITLTERCRIGPGGKVGTGESCHEDSAGIQLMIDAARKIVRHSRGRSTKEKVVEAGEWVSNGRRLRIIGLHFERYRVQAALRNFVAGEWR